MNTKPKCQTVIPWLKANLGNRCLAPLTSTDARALAAAVQIIELWAYSNAPEIARAFGLVVSVMQRSTQHLAFHAIAHVCEWETRCQLWEQAGLEPLRGLTRCAFEPGGAERLGERIAA